MLTYHAGNRTRFQVWGSKSFYGRNFDLWDDQAAMKGRTMNLVAFRKRAGQRFIQRIRPHFDSLVLHYFNVTAPPGFVSAMSDPGIMVISHNAPLEWGAFVIIEARNFSGRELDHGTD